MGCERGALDFDAPEPKFVINDSEQITAIDLPLRNERDPALVPVTAPVVPLPAEP